MTKIPSPTQASHTIIVKKHNKNPDINLELKDIILAANNLDNDNTSNLNNITTKWGVILILIGIKAKETQTEPPNTPIRMPPKKKYPKNLTINILN